MDRRAGRGRSPHPLTVMGADHPDTPGNRPSGHTLMHPHSEALMLPEGDPRKTTDCHPQ